jgi:hypothetical protein
VLADEVYEAMVYAPNSHTRIASLPGMFDRTVTLGSAGKVERKREKETETQTRGTRSDGHRY